MGTCLRLLGAALATCAFLATPAARAQRPPPPAAAPGPLAAAPGPLAAAAALRAAGRNAEAATLYEQALRDPAIDPARAEECRRGLAEIDLVVGRITIRFDDPRARVFLDNRELPGFPSGATVRVEPGDHLVAAAIDGAPPASGPIRVAARETREVVLRLVVPYVSAPPPPGGPVVIPTTAAPIVTTPVVVDRPGAPVASTGEVVGDVLIIGGALVFASGIAAGIAALTISKDAGEHCLGGGDACSPEGVDIQAKAKIAANVSTVGLGVGGVTLIAGLIVHRVYGVKNSAMRADHPRVGLVAPAFAALPGARVNGLGLQVRW